MVKYLINMRKPLTDHFAVSETLHSAVKSVAAESKTEINELVESVLLTDSKIHSAYKRINKNEN